MRPLPLMADISSFVSSGSFSAKSCRPDDVRFTPDSDRTADMVVGPFRANKRHRNALFDHFSGSRQQGRWNVDAERFGGPEVDVQIKLGGLLHRQFTWLRTFQYPVDISRGAAEKECRSGRP